MFSLEQLGILIMIRYGLKYGKPMMYALVTMALRKIQEGVLNVTEGKMFRSSFKNDKDG